MLTPQEVSSRVFSKAVMGGYNMSMVDEFLDELTEDYTALYKENAALKTKLKVMVDKVEEYRATEDSMRAALLAAQKMAEKMISEAEAKKAELLKDVDAAARERQRQLQEETAVQEQCLQRAKEETASFMKKAQDLCQGHMELLQKISQEELAPAPQPDQQEDKQAAADAIEESILSSFSSFETAAAPDREQASADREEENPFARPSAAQDSAPESKPEEEQSSDSIFDDFQTTRRLNLSELKFGRNYNGRGDEE